MATRRGPLLLVGVWVLGVLLATTVGVLAVRQVRAEVGDPATQPLSASEVQRAVVSAGPSARPSPTTTRPRPTPARTTQRPPAAGTQRRTFQSAGGSVAVQCSGGRPSLVYVLPASGWAVDKQETRADRVEVRFRADRGDARIRVSCSASGTPVRSAD
jgi:cytoskeletal protein RodZ